MESFGTIKEFETRKTEAEDRIKTLAAGIGYSLLTKETEAWLSTVSGKNGQLSIEKYNSYNTDRNRLQDDILEIQSTVSDIITSKNSVDESKRQITVLQSGWNELYEKLGEALFDSYTSDFASFFGSYYTDIAVLKQKTAETAASVEALDHERQVQPFFKKIVTSVKYSSMLGSQKYQNNQIKTLYIKGGMNAWITGALITETSNLTFSVPLQDALNACLSLKNNIERVETEAKAYSSQIENYKSHLSKMNANGNGKARIADIEKLIKEKQLQQDSECIIIGNSLYDEFANVKAEKDLVLPVSLSDETRTSICEMFRRHKEIESYNRKIKMIMLSVDIERLDKQTDGLTKLFTANNDRIAMLSNENEELSKRITDNKATVKKLIEQRAAISLLDSGSINLPESVSVDVNSKTEKVKKNWKAKATDQVDTPDVTEEVTEEKDKAILVDTVVNAETVEKTETVESVEKMADETGKTDDTKKTDIPDVGGNEADTKPTGKAKKASKKSDKKQ